MATTSIPRKLVMVGDAGVGKTALLTVIAARQFPTDYSPHVYGNALMDVNVDGKVVDLGLWDTASMDIYDRIRPLSYFRTGIIIICFAINDLNSFHNVQRRWYPEVTHFCPEAPILLLGCKADLRLAREGLNESGSNSAEALSVTREQAQVVASAIGAVQYLECSAKMSNGLNEFLQFSGRIAASWDPMRDPDSPIPPRNRCQIV